MGGGVFGLGGRSEESLESRRNKQKEYADILRAQIREREEARERERAKEEKMVVKDAEEEKVVNRVGDRRKTSSHGAKEYNRKERYGILLCMMYVLLVHVHCNN